jgi:hypothetical protein
MLAVALQLLELDLALLLLDPLLHKVVERGGLALGALALLRAAAALGRGRRLRIRAARQGARLGELRHRGLQVVPERGQLVREEAQQRDGGPLRCCLMILGGGVICGHGARAVQGQQGLMLLHTSRQASPCRSQICPALK